MNANAINLFQIGDKVRVKMREYTSNQARAYIGEIENITGKFITVYTGKFRITVLMAELICGDAKIELLAKYGVGKQWKNYA